jgi:hypothetical protein
MPLFLADRYEFATRLCWSKGKWRFDEFMKLRLPSREYETHSAKGEPAEPVYGLGALLPWRDEG